MLVILFILSTVKVQDSSDVISEGRVRVVFTVPCEPQLDALIQNQHVSAPILVICTCTRGCPALIEEVPSPDGFSWSSDSKTQLTP